VAPAPAPRRDEEEPEFDEDDEVGPLDGAPRTWQPPSVATYRFTCMCLMPIHCITCRAPLCLWCII